MSATAPVAVVEPTIMGLLNQNLPSRKRAVELGRVFTTRLNAVGAAELLERLEEKVNSDPLSRTFHQRLDRVTVERLLNLLRANASGRAAPAPWHDYEKYVAPAGKPDNDSTTNRTFLIASRAGYALAKYVTRRTGAPDPVDAYRLIGNKLELVKIVPQPGMSFANFATPWEHKWSKLVKPSNRFSPVIDEENSVVGHYGKVGFPRLICTGPLYSSLPEALGDGPVFVEEFAKDIGRNRVDLLPPPEGWYRLETTPDQHFVVITSIDGEVLDVVDHYDRGPEEPGFTPLDFVLFTGVLAKLGAKLGIEGVKSLVRRASKRNHQKLLGSTREVAKEAAAGTAARAVGTAHGSMNRWFARSLPNGGRLHMSSGRVHQNGLKHTIDRNRRAGRRQIVLSGTHGKGGKLDWEESADVLRDAAGRPVLNGRGQPVPRPVPEPGPGAAWGKQNPAQAPPGEVFDDGRQFLIDDIKALGKNGHSDIQILDITRMSERELRTVLTGGHDVYAGFCESACSVAIRQAIEAVTGKPLR